MRVCWNREWRTLLYMPKINIRPIRSIHMESNSSWQPVKHSKHQWHKETMLRCFRTKLLGWVTPWILCWTDYIYDVKYSNKSLRPLYLEPSSPGAPSLLRSNLSEQHRFISGLHDATSTIFQLQLCKANLTYGIVSFRILSLLRQLIPFLPRGSESLA